MLKVYESKTGLRVLAGSNFKIVVKDMDEVEGIKQYIEQHGYDRLLSNEGATLMLYNYVVNLSLYAIKRVLAFDAKTVDPQDHDDLQHNIYVDVIQALNNLVASDYRKVESIKINDFGQFKYITSTIAFKAVRAFTKTYTYTNDFLDVYNDENSLTTSFEWLAYQYQQKLTIERQVDALIVSRAREKLIELIGEKRASTLMLALKKKASNEPLNNDERQIIFRAKRTITNKLRKQTI
jgi:hypothetical protein